MKFAFVSAHPAPYRDPFLKDLSRTDRFQVKIFTLFSDDKAHSYWDLVERGYEMDLIGRRSEHWLVLFWRLLRRVLCGGYDMICWPGFHRPCVKMAMIVSALVGKRYGFCADSIKQPPRGGLSRLIKCFVVRKAEFIFVPGAAARDFFVREFGVASEKICTGLYALEGAKIESCIAEQRKHRDALREKYGLKSSDIVFLMVANMLKTRHYPITSEAFVRVAKDCPNVKFVMVGKGDDLEQIQQKAAAHPELRIIPGVSFAEMQDLYAIADVYLHGGTEPASSALVIGAIAHLPVISSAAVGCTADVVREGETGAFVEDYLSVDAWENAIKRVLAARALWPKYGDRARELSRGIDCDVTVGKFVALIEKIGE